MAIFQMSLSIPLSPQSFCFSRSPALQTPLFLFPNLSKLSIHVPIISTQTTIIRMGGGPRTYPGGVSKWQWKRMQAKKSKQLLKARLTRERRIYEMRKRAELKAAITDLERPWEAVKKAPTLFSVSADEQLKALADRFQKPGGLDLWSDKDGPQLFQIPTLNSSPRFFPRGAIPRVNPPEQIGDEIGIGAQNPSRSGVLRKSFNIKFGRKKRIKFTKEATTPLRKLHSGQNRQGDGAIVSERNGDDNRRITSRREIGSPGSGGLKSLNSGAIGSDTKQYASRRSRGALFGRRGNDPQKLSESSDNPGVYDMTLQQDGKYKF